MTPPRIAEQNAADEDGSNYLRGTWGPTKPIIKRQTDFKDPPYASQDQGQVSYADLGISINEGHVFINIYPVYCLIWLEMERYKLSCCRDSFPKIKILSSISHHCHFKPIRLLFMFKTKLLQSIIF